MFTFTQAYHQQVYSMSCWIMSAQEKHVYHATAQHWTNDEQKETEPSQAKWRDSTAIGRPSNLSQEDKLFLMLVRLRLDLKEQDLANRLDFSIAIVSRVFITSINFCHFRLGLLPCFAGQIDLQFETPCQLLLKSSILIQQQYWMQQRSG